ncbi:lysylphosphatidylglycerol synthase domain-containing protein [Rubinisphaera margarita]|uniref:lysylphosphatidylglycerol synthase domain-containing protein n=1 Tax=Rubinisphaera margarita TaxID=2909586 RepID=UPI001EE79306|nr:lysylphosphatidylglycerol synthase domain-containing protein [Rubinisphaera margarita]MCG6157024.1 flippase-like domain-containing protein [Rubinisphaera margarita]
MRRLAIALLKWSLFIVVMIFVVRYGYRQTQQIDWRSISWSPGWLILAVIVYFLGWIPAAWVWGELMRSAGASIDSYSLLRAHFCGHIGKYVPGKALALVIRAALVREFNIGMGLAAMMATVETLFTMSTGMLLTVVLLPVVLGTASPQLIAEAPPQLAPIFQAPSWQRWLAAGVVVIVAAALIPVFSRLLALAAKKLSGKSSNGSQPPELRLPFKTVLLWGIVIGIGWLLNGLSLGLVLKGIGINPDLTNQPLLWTCAVAGATSLGFWVLFAPGGLGVREAILVGLLQLSPQIDTSIAVLASVLLRLVSFGSEVVFALLLYAVPRRRIIAPEESAE